MIWHEYPYEYPNNGTLCLIRPNKDYCFYDKHTVAIYTITSDDEYWVNSLTKEKYDVFEYPLWISLDEIEEE